MREIVDRHFAANWVLTPPSFSSLMLLYLLLSMIILLLLLLLLLLLTLYLLAMITHTHTHSATHAHANTQVVAFYMGFTADLTEMWQPYKVNTNISLVTFIT
jgi:uncharacterized membrane protein